MPDDVTNPAVPPVVVPPPAPAPTPDPAPKADPAPPAPKDSTSQPDKPVVPEKYDLKLSDGSFLDAKGLEKVAAVARERGLSQKDAAALLVNHEKEVAESVDRQANTWLEQTQNDKEIGGAAFNENRALALRVVEKFGSESLKKEMNRLGYGNHPEWVRIFSKIGKHFSDDKAVFPGNSNPGTVEKSKEEIFYPNMFKQEEKQ